MKNILSLTIATLVLIVACKDSDEDFDNRAPGAFSIISPTETSEGVDINPKLTWTGAVDPEGGEVVYELFLDTINAVTSIAGDLLDSTYQMPAILSYETTYYWKVVATDNKGAKSRTEISSFTTRLPDNDPPNNFDLIYPTQGITGIDIQTGLFWRKATDPQGQPVLYDVYFGDTPNPTSLVVESQLDTFYLFENPLMYNQTYYWKVIAKDSRSAMTVSEEGSFTTDLEPQWTDVMASGLIGISDHSSVVYDNQLWVIGDDHVFSTFDGISWTDIAGTPDLPSSVFGHTSAVLDNKMWIFSGFAGNYSSMDGIEWTLEPASPRFTSDVWFSSVFFENKVWIIGGFSYSSGENAEVWYSEDGTNWTEVATSGLFAPRRQHTSVVFNNKIWVIGGASFGGEEDFYFGDVWSSSDGITWNLETADADFGPRRRHASAVYDNKMWVIGGESELGGDQNDVWYSTDGVEWELLGDSEINTFSDRGSHTSIVYDNKLWVIGGNLGGTKYDDVWVYEKD